MKKRLLTAALIALVSTTTCAQKTDLPQLGSSADTILSPQEARQVGASMLHQMRALDMVLDDPLLHQYINDLGYRLVSHAQFPKDMKFTFFIVRDDNINAFAAPGGYIAVNTGLIRATSNESELAGVLAHEIAHISQHHIQRSIEDASKMAPLTALVMLGAVLATQGSSVSGDAAPAIIAGGMGAIAQRQINFTRKDESEADRIGIETLAKAGFNPEGMAGFFSRMERLLRPGNGGDQTPELLRTHPISSERISEAKARAHTIEQQRLKNPKRVLGQQVEWDDTVAPVPYLKSHNNLSPLTANADKATSKLNYQLMRERARVVASSNPQETLLYYAGNLRGDKSFDTLATRYGHALALTRNSKADDALVELEPLLRKHPDNTALRMALADAKLQSGKRGQALADYAALKQEMPQDHAIAEAYATALLADGKSDSASKAAEVLRPLLDEEIDEPTLYRTYGRACSLSGQDIRAAEAYAAQLLPARPRPGSYRLHHPHRAGTPPPRHQTRTARHGLRLIPSTPTLIFDRIPRRRMTPAGARHAVRSVPNIHRGYGPLLQKP